MKTKILKEFDERFNWEEVFSKNSKAQQSLRELFIKAIAQTREETLKEIIREYQDNELDGKDYDFYFSIRAKIDELNKLKK